MRLVCVVCVPGMVADGVLFSGKGFAAINDLEYIPWMLKHGLHKGSEMNPITRGGYGGANACNTCFMCSFQLIIVFWCGWGRGGGD